MRPLVCLTLSLFLAGSAWARPRAHTPHPTPVENGASVIEQTGAVHGRVVTPWGWGISQRIVRIGGQQTFTDGEGRFAFENVSPTYDVEVMERTERPERLDPTAYYGLTRRDPVLTHHARHAMMDGYLDPHDLPPSTGTGRIAGKVELLNAFNQEGGRERLSFIYVFPDGDSGIDLGGCSPHAPGRDHVEGCSTDGSYDYELPDFSSLGGTYCIALGWNTAGARAMRCGGKLGMKDFSIAPQAQPPQITVGDKNDADRILSWTGEGEVFQLTLGHDYMGAFARVYTSKHSFTWSELAALGVNFAGNQQVSVEGIKVKTLLPYKSMDDLISGRGPFALGTSWRTVESREVEVRLPAGFNGFKAAALTMRPGPFNPRDPWSVPSCTSPDGPAIGVGDLQSNMVDTRITVRGHLVCGKGNSECMEGGCGRKHWEWVVVDAGNPQRRLQFQRAEDSAPLEDYDGLCGSPKRPDVEVRATGLLLSRNPRVPRWNSPQGSLDSLMVRAERRPESPDYLLDQVTFCATRPVER